MDMNSNQSKEKPIFSHLLDKNQCFYPKNQVQQKYFPICKKQYGSFDSASGKYIPMKKVAPSNKFPYSAIGKIRQKGELVGTGTLIYKGVVLTCRHNCMDKNGEKKKDLTFQLGQPKVEKNIDAIQFLKPKENDTDQFKFSDYALLFFHDSDLNQKNGYLGTKFFQDRQSFYNQFKEKKVLVIGCPKEIIKNPEYITYENYQQNLRPNQEEALYECEGKIQPFEENDLIRYSTISTQHGQSGGPIVSKETNQGKVEYFLVGIHLHNVGIDPNLINGDEAIINQPQAKQKDKIIEHNINKKLNRGLLLTKTIKNQLNIWIGKHTGHLDLGLSSDWVKDLQKFESDTPIYYLYSGPHPPNIVQFSKVIKSPKLKNIETIHISLFPLTTLREIGRILNCLPNLKELKVKGWNVTQIGTVQQLAKNLYARSERYLIQQYKDSDIFFKKKFIQIFINESRDFFQRRGLDRQMLKIIIIVCSLNYRQNNQNIIFQLKQQLKELLDRRLINQEVKQEIQQMMEGREEQKGSEGLTKMGMLQQMKKMKQEIKIMVKGLKGSEGHNKMEMLQKMKQMKIMMERLKESEGLYEMEWMMYEMEQMRQEMKIMMERLKGSEGLYEMEWMRYEMEWIRYEMEWMMERLKGSERLYKMEMLSKRQVMSEGHNKIEMQKKMEKMKQMQIMMERLKGSERLYEMEWMRYEMEWIRYEMEWMMERLKGSERLYEMEWKRQEMKMERPKESEGLYEMEWKRQEMKIMMEKLKGSQGLYEMEWKRQEMKIKMEILQESQGLYEMEWMSQEMKIMIERILSEGLDKMEMLSKMKIMKQDMKIMVKGLKGSEGHNKIEMQKKMKKMKQMKVMMERLKGSEELYEMDYMRSEMKIMMEKRKGSEGLDKMEQMSQEMKIMIERILSEGLYKELWNRLEMKLRMERILSKGLYKESWDRQEMKLIMERLKGSEELFYQMKKIKEEMKIIMMERRNEGLYQKVKKMKEEMKIMMERLKGNEGLYKMEWMRYEMDWMRYEIDWMRQQIKLMMEKQKGSERLYEMECMESKMKIMIKVSESLYEIERVNQYMRTLKHNKFWDLHSFIDILCQDKEEAISIQKWQQNKNKNVTTLDLSFLQISFFPKQIQLFTKLNKIILVGNGFKKLPQSFKSLNLTQLMLQENQFDSIPQWVYDLSLKQFAISKNNIRCLRFPTSSEKKIFQTLKKFDVSSNKLQYSNNVKYNFTFFKILEQLDISNNGLKYIPELPNSLKIFRAFSNSFDYPQVSQQISSLRSIAQLKLNNNTINKIQFKTNLKHLQKLILNNIKIKNFPEGITTLTHLKILLLQDNFIQTLPADLDKFCQMQELNLSRNRINDICPIAGLLNKRTQVRLQNDKFEQVYQIKVNLGGNPIKIENFNGFFRKIVLNNKKRQKQNLKAYLNISISQ